jgi:hypothetical protein
LSAVFRLRLLSLRPGLAILLIHLVLYPWPDIIPDIQQLHERSPDVPPPPLEPLPTAPKTAKNAHPSCDVLT